MSYWTEAYKVIPSKLINWLAGTCTNGFKSFILSVFNAVYNCKLILVDQPKAHFTYKYKQNRNE